MARIVSFSNDFNFSKTADVFEYFVAAVEKSFELHYLYSFALGVMNFYLLTGVLESLILIGFNLVLLFITNECKNI